MGAPTTVYCFAPAGAGPSFFAPWQGSSVLLDFVAVELPGKERRFGDLLPGSMDELVAEILPQVGGAHAEGGRRAFFGHSFGALTAFATALALEEADVGTDLVLVASGCAKPGVPRSEPIADLPDDAFVAEVSRLAGYTHPALDEPELRELILPVLRSDAAVHEGYQPPVQARLTSPVVALRGRDDTLVSAGMLAGWRDATSAAFSSEELDGRHMYLAEDWRPLIPVLERVLAPEGVNA
ncbi:thioesterase II family protein [Streptomyces avermitilis]|uniref:thioesterase II family protein n=1 Tax=Streptomyces avermitilis TaxID=33903 RepID=UPI0038289CFB